MSKNVSEFYFEAGIIRRVNEGNFLTLEVFFLEKGSRQVTACF